MTARYRSEDSELEAMFLIEERCRQILALIEDYKRMVGFHP